MFIKRHELIGKNLKIFHISDNHKRNNIKYNKKIYEAALCEKPDMIFITGDFVSRTETDFSISEKLLNKLCEISPVYMCMGNHEQSLPDDKKTEFFDMVKQTKARLLINETEYTEIHGCGYYICGVMQDYSTYKKDDNYVDLDDFTLNQMEQLMGERPHGDVLLLAHNPLFAEIYAEWGADYTFSGHIHGGIVRLFGVGMLSPERRFFPKYSKGVYTVNKREKAAYGNSEMKLLVSAGIGKLRLFNPPEVVIYNIL